MIESREHALEVLAYLEKLKARPNFLTPNFPQQSAFVKDDSPRVGLKCTRRAGKSYSAGLKLYRAAYSTPHCTVIYMGLTRKTSKKIMWKDVLKTINRDLNLGLDHKNFNETELSVRLPNGSVIYLEGGDSGKDEMEKVLGGKLKLAIVDEAGSFRVDLHKLCYEMIEPALSDYDGTLCMIGTPTDLLDSLFHKVTDGREKGWSLHSWDTSSNPYMKDNWAKRLAMLKETNPEVEKTPSYRRMYLGEWVTDLSSLVYKFDRTKNLYPGELPPGNYVYAMGIDLGFDDPTAFVIGAFSPHDNTLYIVDAHKAKGMIISDVAERIAYYQKKYDIYRMVIDNASKQAVEELKQRYSLPLVAAEKQGKAEFIEIMNSEYLAGKIKLIDNESTHALQIELGSLIWDDRSTKREEHPACENHLADASLYLWRECWNYLAVPAEKKDWTDLEKVDRWEEDEAEKLEEDSSKEFWERDWE